MAVDLIMWVGSDNYTVSSFIEEVKRMGVSKRIPKNSIPEGIVPGVSRLFIKHRNAIVHATSKDKRFNLEDLIDQLTVVHDMPHYTLPQDMLGLIFALERLQEEEPESWKRYVTAYDLTWTSGVIGFAYITGIQYVAKDNEEGLPEDLVHLEGYVEPIRIEYYDPDDPESSSPLR